MQKIGLLINNMSKGGAQRVVSLLSKYMLSQNACEIHLVMLENVIQYPIYQHVKTNFLCNSKRCPFLHTVFLPIYALRLKSYCRKNNISLILSFLYRANYINVLAAIFGSNHKILLSERTTASMAYSGYTAKEIISRFFLRLFYKRADHIITVSKGVKYDLFKNFSIPVQKMVSIHNPFEIEKIEERSLENVKEEWLNEPQYKIVLGIGRLIKDKRFDNLLSAIKQYHQQNKDIRAIILGEGPQKENLEKLAQRLKISSLVKFVGIIDNPFAYMGRADLLISTSQREGFPNVLVEAMICGCPVISTDCKSGPDEIIEHGKSGILVPEGDVKKIVAAMEKILTDKELRERIIENAKIRARRFSLKNIIPQYENLLE